MHAHTTHTMIYHVRYVIACRNIMDLFIYGPGMFARQRDVIIRSDVTSGVHPPNVPCYSGSLSRILFYVRRRALYIASWNLPSQSYPFACVGVKVRTFRMPWNGSFSYAPGISSFVSSAKVLGFSLMHSLHAILQKR